MCLLGREWFWALVAADEALRRHGYIDLAEEYRSYWEYLVSTAKTLFYAGQGRVWTVVQLTDMYKPVSQNTYSSVGGGLLNDPYEGELFTFMLDLLTTWSDPKEREQLWDVKRPQLVAVNYTMGPTPITVQRGFWFSSHEQLKLLFLPYTAVPIAHNVFHNCEKARAVNSVVRGIPGLFASVNDVTNGSLNIPDYISAAGIPSIASQTVLRQDVVTPYGAFPMALFNVSAAACWYHAMISGPRMVGPYGSTEAVNVNGTEISPLVTWDSKITTMLSFAGGIGSTISEFLKNQKDPSDPTNTALKRFQVVVDREYSAKFPTLAGSAVDIPLPTASIPYDHLQAFENCNV